MKSPLKPRSSLGVHIEIHEIIAFSFGVSFSLVNIIFSLFIPKSLLLSGFQGKLSFSFCLRRMEAPLVCVW